MFALWLAPLFLNRIVSSSLRCLHFALSPHSSALPHPLSTCLSFPPTCLAPHALIPTSHIHGMLLRKVGMSAHWMLPHAPRSRRIFLRQLSSFKLAAPVYDTCRIYVPSRRDRKTDSIAATLFPEAPAPATPINGTELLLSLTILTISIAICRI